MECGRKGGDHVIWWGKPLTRIGKMDRELREMNMIYLARRRTVGWGQGQGSGGRAQVRGLRALSARCGGQDLVVCEFDSRSGWEKKKFLLRLENFFFCKSRRVGEKI